MQPIINLKLKYPELEGIVSRLLELMSLRKLSQRDVCDISGVSLGQLSKIFVFKGIISGQMWMKFAAAGFDCGWLLTGKSSDIQDREIERLNIIVEELRSLIRK